MRAPGLVWEAGLAEEMAAGGKLTFISLGREDGSDEVLGWFIIVEMPDGAKKLLIKRLKYEPRLIKTYAGIVALIREFCPDWQTVTLPILPQLREIERVWELIDGPDQTNR